MTVRKYSSRAQQSTLASAITSTASSMTLVSGGGPKVMGGKTLTGTQTYTLVIDPDTSLEEIVDVTLYSAGDTLTITRGIENTGTGFAHSAGAVVRHMVIGRDLQEANDHSEASTAVHGITGSVVGTTDTQTLSAKTLTTPTIASFTNATHDHSNAAGGGTLGSGVITSTMIANDTIVNADINSSAQIAYSKLNLTNSVVNADINASAAIALSKLATDPLARANHTGTQLASTISDFDTQVRTNRLDQMTAPTASVDLNSQKITGLATPTVSTDAATKGYVDTQVTNLVDAAPGALDTLNELAAALGDDANFSTTVTNSLATKLSLSGGTMTGAIAMGTSKITGLGTPTVSTDAATKAYVDGVAIAPSNLTGPITSVGSATAIAAQTGTGTTFVMQASPTLTTPVLGVATATSINGTSIPSSKTLVATDSTQYVVPSQTGNAGKFLITDGTTSSWDTAVTPGGSQTLTNKTLTSPVLGGTTTTASGNLVVEPATFILEVKGGGATVGQIQLNCPVNSHGQKIASQPHAASATNTLTLPGGTTIGNDDAVLVSDTGTQTLTNKTINLASNTVSATLAQLNSAVSDADVASLAGAETLTNKTISGANNTLSSIANASLTNSSIIINGTAVSLGGSISISADSESVEIKTLMGVLL